MYCCQARLIAKDLGLVYSYILTLLVWDESINGQLRLHLYGA